MTDMAGPRQPLELIEAKGRKHMGKEERALREGQEVRPSVQVKRLTAPDWLPKNQRDEFNRVARALVELLPKYIIRPDADTVATYCMARSEWLKATQAANQALNLGDLEAAQGWSLVQDRYFKQARACANDLGLTISSRCRLVLPEPTQHEAEVNPFLRLMEARRA